MEVLEISPVDIREINIPSYFEKSKFVKELSPKDFDKQGKLKNNGCHFIMFYKPECGFCKKLKKEWLKLAEMAPFYNISAFNVSKYEDSKAYQNVDSKIDGYPTCIIYKKGSPSEIYDGENKAENLVEWLLTKCT